MLGLTRPKQGSSTEAADGEAPGLRVGLICLSSSFGLKAGL